MKEYKYILFDLDGTLTDPAVGITQSVAYALKKFGIEVSDITQLNHFIGPPLLDSFMECYGFDKEKAQTANTVFFAYKSNCTAEFAINLCYKHKVFFRIVCFWKIVNSLCGIFIEKF